VISLAGQLAGPPNLKKPTTLRGVVGVWNCESSDYIRGRDGACLHAVGFLARSERLEHNQCHGLFLSFLRSSSLNSISLFCGDGATRFTFTDSVRGEVAVKDQLESVVFQMYRTGVRCSEAVREFQRAFIITVLKDQNGNQCKAAERLGMHRNTLRRTIRDLDIDIGPTRAIGQRRPPRPDVLLPPVRRRAT
jgi:Fis family transcriptional regulator